MNSIIFRMAIATDVGDISSAISVAARKMSVKLKEKQLEAVEEYMKGILKTEVQALGWFFSCSASGLV